jgi:chemotaxis protein CheZ
MLDPADGIGQRGIDALKTRLSAIRARQPDLEPEMVTEVVRAVFQTISDDLTAKEATLLREVEELGRTIATAKAEIATLRVDDITGHDIPFATDELDAIVEHTAQATHAILESCEMLDDVSGIVHGEPAAKLQAATTRIYEACSFQDITGQRITKVVTTLKTIETKVAQIIGTFGSSAVEAARNRESDAAADDHLLNGPQLPAHAMDQSDIDKLMASFE